MIISGEEIKRFLPHREPFLFIDGVLEMEPGKRIVAVKRFRSEEEFFRGHFPGNPVVPGVIIVEALAQAGGILAYATVLKVKKMPALVGLENVKFRKPVLPGMEVKLNVQILKRRAQMWKMKGEAFVEDMKVAEAEILASLF
jgi:3-hydroxyacyl-[acyl-carrier-protein] dehydratase